MTRVLNAERRAAKSGETRSIVVFLHGYGANGADLLGLADPLGEHLPDTMFVAPDAPENVPGMMGGYIAMLASYGMKPEYDKSLNSLKAMLEATPSGNQGKPVEAAGKKITTVKSRKSRLCQWRAKMKCSM